MLLFLLLLVIVGGILLLRKAKRIEERGAIIGSVLLIGIILSSTIYGMFVATRQVDAYETNTEIFAETIETKEAGIELVRERLCDNPTLVEELIGYLNEEIQTEEKEAQRMTVLKERVENKYRWLIWPIK